MPALNRFEEVTCSCNPYWTDFDPKIPTKMTSNSSKRIRKGVPWKPDLNKLNLGFFSRNYLEVSLACTLLQCREGISQPWEVLLLRDFLQITHKTKKKYIYKWKKSVQHPLTEVLNRHKSANLTKSSRDLHLYKWEHSRPVTSHFWDTVNGRHHFQHCPGKDVSKTLCEELSSQLAQAGPWQTSRCLKTILQTE